MFMIFGHFDIISRAVGRLYLHSRAALPREDRLLSARILLVHSAKGLGVKC
jgi:hypothetical protein